MPQGKTPQSLKTELSKLAKLSNIQGGLPPILRGAPVLAILAGGAIAKFTKGRNTLEERLLGPDETFFLPESDRKPPMVTTVKEKEEFRQGVMMMCARCGQRKTRSDARAHANGFGETSLAAGPRIFDGKGNTSATQWMELMQTTHGY